MTTAYTTTSWTGFGTAAATAAAAVAGLLFMAVSINLKQILDVPGLPSRAAQTLILFATPLAGITLIAAAGGGLYWLVPSLLAALVFGLVNVWVLLVEILR